MSFNITNYETILGNVNEGFFSELNDVVVTSFISVHRPIVGQGLYVFLHEVYTFFVRGLHVFARGLHFFGVRFTRFFARGLHVFCARFTDFVCMSCHESYSQTCVI